MQITVVHFLCPYELFVECILFKCHKGPTTLLRAARAPLDHYFLLRILLIRLSKKYLKSLKFFNTIMLKCIFKKIQTYVIKCFFKLCF